MLSLPLLLAARDTNSEIDPALWVKQQLDAMELKEKVAQLFMVSGYSRDPESLDALEALVIKERIGGIIWMQGSPVRQVEWINHLQLLSKVPLLMAQDLEWGLDMRLKGGMRFPRHMTLGAIEDDALVEEVAREIGHQARLVGIQLVFAPVVDINSDPENPVIHTRSFGEEKSHVARKGVAYLRGLQRAGVLGCAKHFPGHGDTRVDSHLALPSLPFTWDDLAQRELYPFQALVDAGVETVMVGHLALPKIAESEGLPATLSSRIIQEGLRGRVGFEGAVITDALNMKGVAKELIPGELELAAFKAGNDILLMSENPSAGIRAIVRAVERGEISETRVDASVARILALKAKVGLHNKSTVGPLRIRDLKSPEARALQGRAYAEAIALLHDPHELFPLRGPAQLVQIGGDETSPFARAMGLPIASNLEVEEGETLLIALFDKDRVEEIAEWVSVAEEAGKRVAVVLFGSSYASRAFDEGASVIVAFEDTPAAQHAAAKVVTGDISPIGTLPVSIR